MGRGKWLPIIVTKHINGQLTPRTAVASGFTVNDVYGNTCDGALPGITVQERAEMHGVGFGAGGVGKGPGENYCTPATEGPNMRLLRHGRTRRWVCIRCVVVLFCTGLIDLRAINS